MDLQNILSQQQEGNQFQKNLLPKNLLKQDELIFCKIENSEISSYYKKHLENKNKEILIKKKLQNDKEITNEILQNSELTVKKKLNSQIRRSVVKNKLFQMVMCQVFNNKDVQCAIISYKNEESKIFLLSLPNNTQNQKDILQQMNKSQSNSQIQIISKLQRNSLDQQKKKTPFFNNKEISLKQDLSKAEYFISSQQEQQKLLQLSFEQLKNVEHSNQKIEKLNNLRELNMLNQNNQILQDGNVFLNQNQMGDDSTIKKSDKKNKQENGFKSIKEMFCCFKFIFSSSQNQNQQQDQQIPNKVIQNQEFLNDNKFRGLQDLSKQEQKQATLDSQRNLSKQDNIIHANIKNISIFNEQDKLKSDILFVQQSQQNRQQQIQLKINVEKEEILTKCQSSQLQKILTEIEEFQFKQLKLDEKEWDQNGFDKIYENRIQSEILKAQKVIIQQKLIENEFYACKVLASNENEILIHGFLWKMSTQQKIDQDDENQLIKYKIYPNQHQDFDQYIFRIIHISTESERYQLIQLFQTLRIKVDHIKIDEENISIFLIKKIDFFLIKKNFELLIKFKQNIKQIEKYCEINSNECFQCNLCQNLKTCENYECFKNIKSRILAFLQRQNYLYCSYQNEMIEGIIISLKKEELIQKYIKFASNIAFNFLNCEQVDQEKGSILKKTNLNQTKSDLSKKGNSFQEISEIQEVNEYQFNEYIVQNKLDLNLRIINSIDKRVWDINQFNTINRNKLSENFQRNEMELISILKNKNYQLCKSFFSNIKEDIFIGYKEKAELDYQDYIFFIKYYPDNLEIQKYLSIQNFNEEINHFIINNFIHILILSKDNFLQIYYNYNYISQIKIEWTKNYFEEINKDKIINLKNCNKCQECKLQQECSEYLYFRKFQQCKNDIFENLIKKNYFICEYLNKGGEGIIFQGYQQSIIEKKEVVFKILFDYDENEFQNEIEIMKQFDIYVCVVRLIDLLQIKNNVKILILEKFQCSLKDEIEQIQQIKKFPLEKLLQMIFCLLDGLIQFRIFNILHLDIKLSNILMNQSGKYVFTDFGISSLKKKNQKVNIKGWTKNYSSPEQLKNDENIDFQSDIYSLGKTFLFILNCFKDIEGKHYLDMTTKFISIVTDKMIQNQSNERQNCLELSKEFFKQIVKESKCYSFLQQYLAQIKLILSSNPYHKNKETPYFLQVSLSYNQNILIILQLFKKKKKNDKIEILNNQILDSLFDIINCYTDLAEYKQSFKYSFKCLQICKSKIILKYRSIHLSLRLVGESYLNLGNHQKALKYFQRSLKSLLQIFNKNHPDFQILLVQIGCCYSIIGDYKNALIYHLKSYQLFKPLPNQDNYFHLQTLNNIINCYTFFDDQEYALKYFQEFLQTCKSIFKENHPLSCIILNSIGVVYFQLCDIKKSLEYFLESLKIAKQILKENHPFVSFPLCNVGSCYCQLSEYNKALDYQLQSLKIFKQTFKENAFENCQILNNIGITYLYLSDYKNALEYLFEYLKIIKSTLNKDHYQQVAVAYSNIGLCYHFLGEQKTSLIYQLESLLIEKQIDNKNSPYISKILNNLSFSYLNNQQYKKSLKYALKANQILQKRFKENDVDVAIAMVNLGICYFCLGDTKNALKNLFDSLQMMKQYFKEYNHLTAQCLLTIGMFYYKLNQSNRALIYLLESNQIYKQIFKNNSNNYFAESLELTGLSYLMNGQTLKALEYSLQSLEMNKNLYKQNNIQIFKLTFQVILMYLDLGDDQLALDYLQELESQYQLEFQICLYYLKSMKGKKNDKFKKFFSFAKINVQ